jgi:uncharacterized alpha-E superfamily protein
MLSRIADSLFWTARYMDRAENAARLLDVTYHMLLEQSQQTYRLRWEAVITISSDQDLFYRLYKEATPENVCEFLLFSTENQNSVVSCVTNVRENARAIRDRISREMWENVNGLYHRLREIRESAEISNAIHGFCREIIAASHAFNGITDSTLPHDEGWHFLQAGRALERTENTARILDVEYHKLLETSAAAQQADNHQWIAVLKSVAAYEIFRRAYHSAIEPQHVAELLILHPQHPRSVRFNIAWLQGSLRAISGTGAHRYSNEAERLTGKLHDSLVYDRIEDIFARGLHVFLNDLEGTCRQIGEHIASTYFYYAGVAS